MSVNNMRNCAKQKFRTRVADPKIQDRDESEEVEDLKEYILF